MLVFTFLFFFMVGRLKLSKAELDGQVVCSPPTTGLILQSYSTFQPSITNSNGSSSKNGKNGKGRSEKAEGNNGVERNSVISALYAKPKPDPAVELIADGLALLVTKQTEQNIDKLSAGQQDYSAVVSFKPFVGSIHSR